MRTLTKGRLARTLASVLMAVFLAPLMGWGLAVPATAQITMSSQLELVAVAPFQNLTSVQPETLGNKAADAIGQALLDTQAYSVRSRTDTEQRMGDLGLRTPMVEAEMARLGAAMDVGGIVFGEIRDAGVVTLTRSTCGQVTLMVGVFDVASRTMRGGTIVTSRSSSVPVGSEANPDKLIDQALSQAVFEAISQIRNHPPIIGYVQYMRDGKVQISVGQPQGVLEAMKFVVLRDGRRVGILSIDHPDRNFSDATLIEGDARTSDIVREIFMIPEKGSKVPTPGVAEAKNRNRSNLIYGVLLAALLGSIGSNSSSGTSSPSFTAASVTNVVDLAGLPVSDPEIGAPSGASGAALQLRWKDSTSEFTAGYEVWRDSQLYWFIPAIGGPQNSWTSPTPAESLQVTITVDPNTGIPLLDLNPVVPPSDYTPGTRTGEGTSSMQYTLPGDWLTVETFTVYNGPAPGSQHAFTIRRVVSSAIQNPDGTKSWILTANTPISSARRATYQAPVTLLVPENQALVIDPTAVSFGFSGSGGANEYLLQVSLDPTFSAGVTSTDPLTQVDGPHPASQLIVVTKNLVTLMGSLPSGTPVYWRVGVRNNTDSDKPMPYGYTKVPKDSFRYVFSAPRQLLVQ